MALRRLLAIVLFVLVAPSIASAATGATWQTTPGNNWITPSLINGTTQGLIINASSTWTKLLNLQSASSTVFSATTICFTGDICRTTWPSGSSSASSTLLSDNNTWIGKNVFSNASSSLTTLTSTWYTGITNSLLGTDNNGKVSASSTIGWNLLKGPASSIFAFDSSGNPTATSSIGTNYLTGSLLTINGTNFNVGDSKTITAASSTLLTDNNTFSGNNIFTASTTMQQQLNLQGASSTLFSANTICLTADSCRTTWPSGSGSPGGSSGQLQYNNGGNFGGASLLYYDSVNNRFGIGTSSPSLAFSIASTTPVITEDLYLATSTGMSLGIASGTVQHIDYSTSAVTITVSAYQVMPGESTRVFTCGPNSGTGGAITWAAASGVGIHFPGNVQPGNTTQASTCDEWFLDVDWGPIGSTTPWVYVSQAAGYQ